MAEKKSTKENKAPAKNSDEKKIKPTSTKVKEKKKGKGGLIAGILAGVIAVVGIVVAIVCLSGKGNPADPKAKITYTNSFFIYDNSKYTLWNAEGKRITEDTYEYASNFIAGYAYVKKDGMVGIMDQNGRMTVEFGKYGEMSNKGGLFLARDGNTKEFYLLTGTGQELLHGDNLEVTASNSTGGFAVASLDGKTYVYNYSGKLITSVEEDEEADDAITRSSDDFGLFYYNNHNWVFDARNGQVLADFEGGCHSFDSVSENRDKILLQSDEEEEKYKLIVDGKMYELDEMKYYAITVLGDIIGYDSYSELALLDENYKVAEKVASDLSFKDHKNYAAINDDSGDVEVYKNGEKVATFSDDTDMLSGVLYEDYYAIKDGNTFKFYNLDGTVAYDHEYYEIRTPFNKHHMAVVSDEENKYYLIDASWNRVGDWTARQITTRDGGYELKDNDSKYAIANIKGEIITDFKYTSLYYRSNVVDHNIWTGRNDDSDYDIIDADEKKAILEHVNIQNVSTNYFSVKNDDGKIDFYTYEGELFYSSES